MILEMKYCFFESKKDGCTTHFPEGSVPSLPHNTPHYHVISHRCGYEGDVLRYCIEHDFIHNFLEEELFDRPSRVLHAVALGSPLSGAESAHEEVFTQTFQRFLRGGERPIIGGVPWNDLRIEALRLLEKL